MSQEEVRPIAIDRNAILATLQRPRIMLILLAAWDILGAFTEFFTSSDLFMNLHGGEIDGILAARALSWQSIPLAVLYLYVARNPQRYPRIFMLALIEQAAAVVAAIYHLGAGDFGAESIILPVAVSGGLLFLILLHLFGGRPETPASSQSA
ncbi:MAG TPA: hypothetical protein VNL15_08405 [Dehalococcoidia bacterium]|nr:hypothetical protein [Dehalococcoidia bacterium]